MAHDVTDEKLQRDLLSYQQEQGFLKHLTTLNTGSILLIVTFLDKLFKNPEWTLFIGIALVAFIISILGCVTAHLASVLDVDTQYTKENNKGVLVLQWITLLMSFGGFVLGLIFLSIFTLKNLY